ncbi:hypothetical protein ES703_113090 [subsurface metagenome]
MRFEPVFNTSAHAHALVGAKHTASGLTIGHVVKATAADTFAWGQLPHDKLGGLGDDDHALYHTNTRGDARYFRETEFIATSEGELDAGKPVKTDETGMLHSSLVAGHTHVKAAWLWL